LKLYLDKLKSYLWLQRLSVMLLGFILFYAPVGLLARFSYWVTGRPERLATESVWCNFTCLPHGVDRILRPDQWYKYLENPALMVIFVIIIIAFLFAPLFCGWMCAAGGVTEFLGRLIPNRFKLDLRKHTEPSAIRYGFLAGFLLVPFIAGLSVACAYCHFITFQEISMGLITWDLSVVSRFTMTTGLIAFLFWFVILGLFTKGGRGWCNYVCPVGAIQSAFHRLGSALNFTYKLKFIPEKCTSCGKCEVRCPMWAIKMEPEQITRNYNHCIGCQECKDVCPSGAIIYGRGQVENKSVPVQPEVVPGGK
jgi:ferredoxin-type protein NapH